MDPERQYWLANLRRENEGADIFLRVVQRVYLTGGVVVTLVNTDAKSLAADVGVPKSISILNLSGDTEANLNAASDELNDLLGDPADPAVGGSFKLVEASRRSVTLNEKFDRLLVIGYLGYDFPIEDGGKLGMPIATLQQLENRAVLKRPTLYEFNADADAATLRNQVYAWLEEDGNAHYKERIVKLADFLDERFAYTGLQDSWLLSASADQLQIIVNEFVSDNPGGQ